MTRIASLVSPLCVFSILVLWGCSGLRGDETVSEQQLACAWISSSQKGHCLVVIGLPVRSPASQE